MSVPVMARAAGNTKIQQGRQQEQVAGPGTPQITTLAYDVDSRLARENERDEGKRPQFCNS